MRTTTIFATITALVATVAASPAPGNWRSPKGAWGWGHAGAWHKKKGGWKGERQCLTDDDAQEAAGIFRQLIQEYSDELALEALTEDFQDYTSAVAIIRNRGAGEPFQVNAVTFDGRQAFMDAQGSQPQIPFTTLNVFHGCNHTVLRWQTERSANGQPTEVGAIPVVGIAILETVPDNDNSYGFRIRTLYSEFNAAAWLVNLGVFKPNGTVTPPPDKRSIEARAPAPDADLRGNMI